MSSHISEAFLEHDLIHQFHDLLSMIEERDERFFWWNDIYFMSRCQDIRFQEIFTKKFKDPKIAELTEMILYRRPPKTVRHKLFEHRLLKADTSATERTKLISRIRTTVNEWEQILKKHGTGKEWILADLPEKDVIFTRPLNQITHKRRGTTNIYLERDPIKVVSKNGTPTLLVERENTLMNHLSSLINFVPSVYANDSAIALLKSRKLIDN